VADQQRQQQRIKNLVGYIQDNGGTVTSVPGVSPLRFHCAPDSRLPAQLELLLGGTAVSFCGVDRQISPVGYVEKRIERDGGVERERIRYEPALCDFAVYTVHVSTASRVS